MGVQGVRSHMEGLGFQKSDSKHLGYVHIAKVLTGRFVQ